MRRLGAGAALVILLAACGRPAPTPAEVGYRLGWDFNRERVERGAEAANRYRQPPLGELSEEEAWCHGATASIAAIQGAVLGDELPAEWVAQAVRQCIATQGWTLDPGMTSEDPPPPGGGAPPASS